MNAAGVIVEYNPFHNGHKFHLEQTRLHTNAECIIAVMSGHFLQRGEPALVSKWIRTKMALEAGVDVVIELPYAFATQKAENFANGAISILEALHCNTICFGSEHGEINEFLNTVTFMKENKDEFDRYVQEDIKKGVSYPSAVSFAYHSLNKTNSILDLTKPNNILGFHYVKAIHDQQSQIQPYTIERTKANYHDQEFTSKDIASATSIRKQLFHGTRLDEIEHFVPLSTKRLLESYQQQPGKFQQWEDYFHLLKYRILSTSSSELRQIYEVEEGLEYRILRYVKKADSFKQFMELIKTKRYTWTRLQRVCLHILTNTKKIEMEKVNERGTASYIRLLGMTTTGQRYLKSVKKNVSLPIVSTLSSFSNHSEIHLDIKAASIYAMCFPEPLRSRLLEEEYGTPPIRYDQESSTYIY